MTLKLIGSTEILISRSSRPKNGAMFQKQIPLIYNSGKGKSQFFEYISVILPIDVFYYEFVLNSNKTCIHRLLNVLFPRNGEEHE